MISQTVMYHPADGSPPLRAWVMTPASLDGLTLMVDAGGGSRVQRHGVPSKERALSGEHYWTPDPPPPASP